MRTHVDKYAKININIPQLIIITDMCLYPLFANYVSSLVSDSCIAGFERIPEGVAKLIILLKNFILNSTLMSS